jgi:hypothetical protein
VAHLIVYAVLVTVVVLPLLLGRSLLPRPVAPNQAVTDLHRMVRGLNAGSIALVAFDYDPSTSEEMDLLARTIVAHLLDRNIKVAAVSLLPAGAATAQGLLESIMTDPPGYQAAYGQHYANLGYVPGQSAAVRLLNRDLFAALPRDYAGNPLEDLPVMEGVFAVRDFDLIIDLAADQDSLRWWIEQASTPSKVPVGAGVSASVEPLARPYYQTATKQLGGYAGGVMGAASYEALRTGSDYPSDVMGARLDAQLGGHLLLALVIIAGNVTYFARRWAGRTR